MSLPLAGVTVLDLTRLLAGPFATMVLADLGATVIKIERPDHGDGGRTMQPLKDGRSAWFAAVNRGKKSIAVDLEADEDRDLLQALVERSDVLVENFRPGIMARFGLDWESLHPHVPGLVYASLSGYGQTGPDARRPAYDTVVQARGGLMGLTGTPDGAPLRAGGSMAEVSAGLYLAIGVLAALTERARTGLGRRIDVGMLDAQISVLGDVLAMAAAGRQGHASASRHPSIAPSEAVAASDGAFVLTAGNDALFEKLCLTLELPLAGDPRFADNAARLANARLLKRLIEAVTLEHPRAHWLARLTAAGIPCSPVQSMGQVLKDPQVAARNMVIDVLDRYGRATFKAAGNPVKMSGMEDKPTRPSAPDLDANRAEILRWLGET